MTEWAVIIPLAIGGICSLPFLLLAAGGMLYAFAYPYMLIWAFFTSGKRLDNQIADTHHGAVLSQQLWEEECNPLQST